MILNLEVSTMGNKSEEVILDMEKEFNITGTCIPNMHYMVDTSNKIDKTIKLINKGKYFIINRPRQY